MKHPSASVRKAGDEITFAVTGMDCASCAATITTAMGRLPGVRDPVVSVARETLTLRLNPAMTPVDRVQGVMRDLGFRAELLGGAEPAPATPGNAPARRLDGFNRLPGLGHALLGAGLLAAAVLLDRILPGSGRYAYAAVTLVLLVPVARKAFAALRLGAPFTIQMLMTLAASGALVIGEAAEAATVVLLFLIGEMLEGLAAARARAGIRALDALVPRTATVEEAGGLLRDLPAASLRIGQVVLCRPGDRIPADGVVLSGLSGVDESAMTGESLPVAKEPGARVFAGSVNHEAPLRIRVDREADDTTLARIVTLVEEAQEAKAPTERFIDAFSRVYMPAIVALAVLVAVLPPLLGAGDWDIWIYRGLALLLIGCPCALVISVPAAIAASLAAGTRQGMLIKGGAVIENLARAEIVAFDKTGTLTQGRPQVTDVVAEGCSPTRLLSVAAGIERESSHPLAEAICRHAEAAGIAPQPASALRNSPGQGMQGQMDGAPVFVGAPRFAADHGTLSPDLLQAAARLETEGKTLAAVMAGGQALGLIALRDEPRPDAAAGVAALQALGLDCVMLTGDNPATARAIAEPLGVTAHAGLLPEDKLDHIRSLSASRVTVMVGDGVNDAPALAMAQVGLAIGSGTDVAMEAADAALMRNRIGDIAGMIRLSRQTMRIIRQNVLIALGLKAVFLVTTITGLTGLWLAVLADTGATVLVTLNALRLMRRGRDD